MNQPEILNTIELLRRFKAQKNFSNAQLAAYMTSASWVWGETFIADLFSGRSKPTPEQAECISRILAMAYYKENLV